MKIDTNHPGYVLAFVTVVSAGFTAAIMSLHQATAERVQRNEGLREQRALVELFGLGDAERMTGEEVARVVAERVQRGIEITDPQTGRTIRVLRAYDRPRTQAGAKVSAVGFPVSGMGFWAPIRGLMAATPDLKRIVGVVFLGHSETPGLGARIEEKAFRG